MSVEEIESLLTCNLTDGNDARGPLVAETFTAAVAALSSRNVSYVIGGVLAYGVYARARFTDTIDLLTVCNPAEEAAFALRPLGLKELVDLKGRTTFHDVSSGIDLVMRAAANTAERMAIQHPTSCTIFGAPALVMQQEYLAWALCLSVELRRLDMLIGLINEGMLNLEGLSMMMEEASDDRALEFLGHAKAAALRERGSSYSKSVEARLERRRSGKQPPTIPVHLQNE